MTKKQIDADLARIAPRGCTYGQLERAAGVADRVAFWTGKTEDEGRAELRRMIRDRIQRGELPESKKSTGIPVDG